MQGTYKLFAFGDGTGRTVIDASEAFDTGIGIDNGMTVVIHFDGFCRATGFARTTTNASININNRLCHFSSPKMG